MPRRVLYGFKRVHLIPGASAIVTFAPRSSDLTLVNESGAHVAAPGNYTFSFGVRETVAHGGGFVECNSLLYTEKKKRGRS